MERFKKRKRLREIPLPLFVEAGFGTQEMLKSFFGRGDPHRSHRLGRQRKWSRWSRWSRWDGWNGLSRGKNTFVERRERAEEVLVDAGGGEQKVIRDRMRRKQEFPFCLRRRTWWKEIIAEKSVCGDGFGICQRRNRCFGGRRRKDSRKIIV